MRIHWLQHADFEGLGCISPWLAERGHAVAGAQLHAGETLPDIADFDALIVMGGPMNIYEYATHPWLRTEKALIRAAIGAGRRVLGICLAGLTRTQVLLYTVLLTAVTVLPFAVGMSGWLYLVGTLILDGLFLYYAFRLKYAPLPGLPMKTFGYSIVYLMAIFTLLLVDHYLPRAAL